MTDKNGNSSPEREWIPDWYTGTPQGATRPTPHGQGATPIERHDRLSPSSFIHESHLNNRESWSASQNSGPTLAREDIALANLSDDAEKNGIEETGEEEPTVDRVVIERDRDRAVKYVSLWSHGAFDLRY